MRLLNIYSLELEEFTGDGIPPNFILSHRWEGKETCYEAFVSGHSVGTPGHQKVEEFCAFSRVQTEDVFTRSAWKLAF